MRLQRSRTSLQVIDSTGISRQNDGSLQESYFSPNPGREFDTPQSFIDEQYLTLFNFYMNDVHEGMRFGKELYRLTGEFSVCDKLGAYQLYCAFILKKIPAIISVSSDRYAVWISLRAVYQ